MKKKGTPILRDGYLKRDDRPLQTDRPKSRRRLQVVISLDYGAASIGATEMEKLWKDVMASILHGSYPSPRISSFLREFNTCSVNVFPLISVKEIKPRIG